MTYWNAHTWWEWVVLALVIALAYLGLIRASMRR